MSIFDPIHSTLSKEIFSADKKINPEIRNYIFKKLYSIIPPSNVSRVLFLGSMTGYRYNQTSDIDVTVVVDKSVDHMAYKAIFKKFNGSFIPGTEHPLNFFAMKWHKPNYKFSEFGIYNLTENRWEVVPSPPKQLNIKKDVTYAEFFDDQIELLVNQLDKLLDRNPKPSLKQIQKKLNQIYDIYTRAEEHRKATYSSGWGTPRYSPANIVYKYLEKKPYSKLIDYIKEHFKN